MLRKFGTSFALLATAACALAGCSGGGSTESEQSEPAAALQSETSQSSEAASASEGQNYGDITIFAAKSLTKSFTELGEAFEAENPGSKVTFSFDGSQNLVDQIHQGSPADALFTADQKNMDKAAENGDVEADASYATNTLVMVVPKGNPGQVEGFTTEALEGKKLVVCAEGVPCGNATKTLAEKNGITFQAVSEEQNVGDTLAKVETGEADAGLVYKTDAMSSDKVDVIEIENADRVVNDYRVALTKSAKNKEGGQAFIDFILSDKGQQVLDAYGFTAPTTKQAVHTDIHV